MRRNVLVVAVVGGMIAAAGGGWALASQIRSPAELAAAAEPPSASNITVEVVRQTLSADVITRGDIVYDEPVQLSLSGSFADQPEKLVVTATSEVDTELAEGEAAVEVVGRPVFVLDGEIPAFRDLRPGASGVDVLQLEEALERLGFLSVAPDETFDADTSAAVAAWYEEQGYPANATSDEDEAALRAARERVRNAETALEPDREGGRRAERLQASAEVDAAVAALEIAELDAQRANARAARASERATAERAQASERLQRADAGEHPDTGQPPTSSELDQLRRELADADDALDDAEFEVERTTKEQAAAVDQARDRVRIARAALEDLDRIGGGDDAAAEEELEVARTELAELEAKAGVWLPAGEFVFVPGLPVRVDQVSVARGSVIEGSFLTVSGSVLALRTSVPEREAGLLSVGMPVEIENPDGPPVAGAITEIAERSGTRDVPPDRVYVEVEPEELPSELIGANVRVTIPVSSTAGDVLAVPAAALSATATGATIVQVEEADGTLRTIEVEPGLATGGSVEVTPLSGELGEGDLVVVGRDDGSPVDVDEVGSDADPAEPDADGEEAG